MSVRCLTASDLEAVITSCQGLLYAAMTLEPMVCLQALEAAGYLHL